MPRRTKAGTSEESARCCCLGRKLLSLLLENQRHRKRETGGIKAAEQVDTRRDQELLTQLGVNIEHLVDDSHNDGRTTSASICGR
jgi:predicted lactoylglutathione lyase